MKTRKTHSFPAFLFIGNLVKAMAIYEAAGIQILFSTANYAKKVLLLLYV